MSNDPAKCEVLIKQCSRLILSDKWSNSNDKITWRTLQVVRIANEGASFLAKTNQVKAKDVFVGTFANPAPNPKYSRLANYNKKKRWPKLNTKRKKVNLAKRGKTTEYTAPGHLVPDWLQKPHVHPHWFGL